MKSEVESPELEHQDQPKVLPEQKPEPEFAFSSQTPWFPPAEPYESKKSRLAKAEWVAQLPTSDDGPSTIRSLLIPGRAKDSTYMAQWRIFWRMLAFEDWPGMQDMLMDWLEAAEKKMGFDNLLEEERTWVRRFIGDVKGALDRLDRARNEPLGWAGAKWALYPPQTRVTVEALVGAIDLHRQGKLSNDELYTVLDRLKLNPRECPTGTPESNMEAIFNAIVNGDSLDRTGDEPLEWAGEKWAAYRPEARVTVETLVGAIDLVRQDELNNDELHTVLDCLKLNPRKRDPGITARNMDAIFNAIAHGDNLDLKSTYARS